MDLTNDKSKIEIKVRPLSEGILDLYNKKEILGLFPSEEGWILSKEHYYLDGGSIERAKKKLNSLFEIKPGTGAESFFIQDSGKTWSVYLGFPEQFEDEKILNSRTRYNKPTKKLLLELYQEMEGHKPRYIRVGNPEQDGDGYFL